MVFGEPVTLITKLFCCFDESFRSNHRVFDRIPFVERDLIKYAKSHHASPPLLISVKGQPSENKIGAPSDRDESRIFDDKSVLHLDFSIGAVSKLRVMGDEQNATSFFSVQPF